MLIGIDAVFNGVLFDQSRERERGRERGRMCLTWLAEEFRVMRAPTRERERGKRDKDYNRDLGDWRCRGRCKRRCHVACCALMGLI